MDQFVTTYRRDFLWPYVRAFGMKPDSGPRFVEPLALGDACRCPTALEPHLVGPNVYAQDSFQKPGPTTPLLDPKMYPSKVGPPPENDIQRFNQPNVFLERLKAKYPYLYEVLRSASPDDIIVRINRERLRTTYQTDFCNLREYPSVPYDQLLRGANIQSGDPCLQSVGLPGEALRPDNKSPLGFRSVNSQRSQNPCRGGSFGNSANANSLGVPGTTEYQDAISKLGEHIIRDKIHYRRFKPTTVF